MLASLSVGEVCEAKSLGQYPPGEHRRDASDGSTEVPANKQAS